jgi:hypothetical protein
MPLNIADIVTMKEAMGNGAHLLTVNLTSPSLQPDYGSGGTGSRLRPQVS